MGQIKTDLIKKLKGFAPFEQIAMLYEDRSKFFAELNNYMIGGLVISTPSIFLMLKPIDRSVDPSGQWYAEKPDCWYCRWAAGIGGLKEMMDSIEPLPFLMFRRVTENGETALLTYKWDSMYRKVSYEQRST